MEYGKDYTDNDGIRMKCFCGAKERSEWYEIRNKKLAQTMMHNHPELFAHFDDVEEVIDEQDSIEEVNDDTFDIEEQRMEVVQENNYDVGRGERETDNDCDSIRGEGIPLL